MIYTLKTPKVPFLFPYYLTSLLASKKREREREREACKARKALAREGRRHVW